MFNILFSVYLVAGTEETDIMRNRILCDVIRVGSHHQLPSNHISLLNFSRADPGDPDDWRRDPTRRTESLQRGPAPRQRNAAG